MHFSFYGSFWPLFLFHCKYYFIFFGRFVLPFLGHMRYSAGVLLSSYPESPFQLCIIQRSLVSIFTVVVFGKKRQRERETKLFIESMIHIKTDWMHYICLTDMNRMLAQYAHILQCLWAYICETDQRRVQEFPFHW